MPKVRITAVEHPHLHQLRVEEAEPEQKSKRQKERDQPDRVQRCKWGEDETPDPNPAVAPQLLRVQCADSSQSDLDGLLERSSHGPRHPSIMRWGWLSCDRRYF